MKRTFKYFAVTSGVTQPLVGTTLGAQVNGSNASQSMLVGDSSMFRVGDYVLIGTEIERVRITSIPDATHIIGILTSTQLTGVAVRLWASCSNIYVQTKDGNVGNVDIGNASVIDPTTGVGEFVELVGIAAGVQPVELREGNTTGINSQNIANYWATGTNTGDTYLPSFEVS